MYSPSHYLNVWGKRMVGIEPTTSAWKADVLPLNYTRTIYRKDAESALGVPGTIRVTTYPYVTKNTQQAYLDSNQE